LLKKDFSLGSRSRIIKVFYFFDKTPFKGFTQVLVSFSFTYYQCKGSIQPLPLRQRYSPPLDPNAINDNQIICLRYKRGPARAFFIIMQKEHSDSIGKAVNNFLEKWQEHFERSQK
jgi:hypothetical protein